MAGQRQQAATWSHRPTYDTDSQAGEGPVPVRGFDANQDDMQGRTSPVEHYYHGRDLRRRSSVAERLGSIADVGGVNSLNNFARSWQRAAGYMEVASVRRSFAIHPDADGEYVPSDAEHARGGPRDSLLRAAIGHEHDRRKASHVPLRDDESVFDDDDGASTITGGQDRYRQPSIREESIFQIEPALASPFGGSYGATYGSLSSRINESSIRHAGRLFMKQQAASAVEGKETEPLLVKTIDPEGDGKMVNIVVGQSTLPQTVFNSTNVLVGVGILSLPLAIRYTGWLIGLLFFLASALVTSYTAKLLAKCLDADGSLITFGDLAYVSFGAKARVATSLLFVMELLAACVALVILFADSLDALVPGWGLTEFKIVCGIVIIPLIFTPLRFLSLTSVLGIISCLWIVIATIINGLIKPTTPGSLREPAQTYLLPQDWRALPLGLSLLMAPWGGHSVFPAIYRDMRHPHKYTRGVNYTYVFVYFLEVTMAIVGYLMFGEDVLDEITANIFLTKGYPRWISILMVIAIAIIPITKIPLNARPIISTVELFCGLDPRVMPNNNELAGMSALSRGILTITIRVITVIVIVVIAIFVPSFDRVMALMGSLACFTICIILPCGFHLKIFGKDLSLKQKMWDWFLIVLCTILAVAGTVCACLPKSLLGLEE